MEASRGGPRYLGMWGKSAFARDVARLGGLALSTGGREGHMTMYERLSTRSGHVEEEGG